MLVSAILTVETSFLIALAVFLALAALYESWTMPLAVILVVPMCLLSAIIGVNVAEMDINIFTQVGFVVLVGLASKNAILIVEFAKKEHESGAALRRYDPQTKRLFQAKPMPDLQGPQWGMMNETGNYPGQAWLWLYTMWYQVAPFNTSSNGDVLVWALMMLLTLGLLLVPFIPGVRSVPRLVPVYKLIWRDHYRNLGPEVLAQMPPEREDRRR